MSFNHGLKRDDPRPRGIAWASKPWAVPVPIVAVLASQLRQLIKVGSAGRGGSAALAKSLGMAPWQVDKARRSVGHWSGDGLGVALQAVAAADFEVKGGGRDPVYAVERAILTVTRARGIR